jgi:predicted transcriptional regulator
MAIQPRFAQAILSGSKQVEFRKRRLAADIETVVIYETAPTQRITGHFTIARTVEATPTALWYEFASAGGIARDEFTDYYTGHERAVGFVIKDTEQYQRPVALPELSTLPSVPQSFVYLPAAALDEITSRQPAANFFTLPSLVGRLLEASGRLLAGVASR